MTQEKLTPQSELNQWVGPELTQQAGFRPESSGWFIEDKDFSCRIYAGFIPNPKGESKGLHLVAGVKVREGNKITWYFETFEGSDFLYMTAEENQNHQQMVRDVLVRKNRVAGRKLESLIREVMESESSKILSQSPA